MFKLLKRLLWILEELLQLKENEIEQMSALTDATAALAASATALTAAVAALPPPVDESAAVTSIQSSQAQVDAATNALKALTPSH